MWQHSGIALFFVVSNLAILSGRKEQTSIVYGFVRWYEEPRLYSERPAKKYKRGGVKNPLTASKEKLHLQPTAV